MDPQGWWYYLVSLAMIGVACAIFGPLLGFRLYGLGSRGLGFRVWALGFRGLGFRIYG